MNPIRFTLLAALPLAFLALPVVAPLPVVGGGVAQAAALSPAVGGPLKSAQAAAKAGNISGALAQIGKARAASKTAADRTATHQMAGYVYVMGRQYGNAAAELEQAGASPKQLAPLYYQAGQYNKAIAAANKSGNTTIVAQSYLKMGKNGEAAKIYQKMLAANPNNSSALQNLAGIQYRSGNRQAYLASITKLIRLDPTPNRWRAVLLDMRNDGPKEAQLGVYHLMRITGALKPTEFQDYAKLAIIEGQPGVATGFLKDAADPMAKNMLNAAQKRQAAAASTAAANARKPATAMMAGGAYMGAGNYAAAAAAYGVAMKGPARAAATLNRGIAQALGGQYAAARATLKAVPDGDYKNIANMWSLYSSTKGG